MPRRGCSQQDTRSLNSTQFGLRYNRYPNSARYLVVFAPLTIVNQSAAMYRYLDMEQPTYGLCREESISDTARRQALSIVFHDEDDSSGILEHKIPLSSLLGTTSLRTVDSHNDKLVERKRRAVTVTSTPVPITVRPSVEEKLLRDGHLAVCIQVVDDARDRLEESEVTITRRGLERVESGSIDAAPPTFRRNPAQRTQTQTPGAYRQGGGPTTTLQRHNSGRSLGTTASLIPRWKEVLVDAELVSPSNSPGQSLPHLEYQKSMLVEASLVDESEQLLTASFVTVIKTNRKVQTSLCVMTFALLAMALATSLTLLVGHQSNAVVDFDTSSAPSASPSTNNELFLMQVLKSNLPAASLIWLNDMQSSQYKAMKWLQEDALIATYNEERMLQRFVLAQFFYSTGGQTQWTDTNGWLSEAHECSWYSSSTHPSICKGDTLIRLSLYRNGLGGSIPDELGLLTNLVEMKLQTQTMVGSLPGAVLGQLTNLENMSISGNLMSGNMPTEIGLLTNLTQLMLFSNGIDGTLPTELGLLTNAVTIHFFHQFLAGTIPTEIGLLTNLESLWLWMNRLSGAIPSEIGYLTRLRELPMHDNALSGNIPTEMGNLVFMDSLEIQRNKLTGSVPSQLGNLKAITRFNLGNNSLTGSIPTELMQATDLLFFSSYSNQLAGKIPTQIGQLTILEELYLDINDLTGTLPSELGSLHMLTDMWVNANSLTGIIPKELCYIQTGIMIQLDCRALNCSCLGIYESVKPGRHSS